MQLWLLRLLWQPSARNASVVPFNRPGVLNMAVVAIWCSNWKKQDAGFVPYVQIFRAL